jgi:hypothetical protein
MQKNLIIILHYSENLHITPKKFRRVIIEDKNLEPVPDIRFRIGPKQTRSNPDPGIPFRIIAVKCLQKLS